MRVGRKSGLLVEMTNPIRNVWQLLRAQLCIGSALVGKVVASCQVERASYLTVTLLSGAIRASIPYTDS